MSSAIAIKVAADLHSEFLAWRDREHLKSMEARKDGIAADRRLGEDRGSYVNLRYELDVVTVELASAMRDPDLGLHSGSRIEAAGAYYRAFQDRLPAGVKEDVEHMLDQLRAAQAACDRWAEARAALKGPPTPTPPTRAEWQKAEEHRLREADHRYDGAWKRLRDAGQAIDGRRQGLDDYGARRFGVGPPPVSDARREMLKAPLDWGPSERGRQHHAVLARDVKAQAAQAALEREGRPDPNFSAGLEAPGLAWVAATRCPEPDRGAYLGDRGLQAGLDQLWANRAHLPEFPPLSDEMKIQVLESSYPAELDPALHRIRSGLAQADPVAAQARREEVAARAQAEHPSLRQRPAGPGQSVAHLVDPAKILEAAAENESRALTEMQKLAHTNENDAYDQAKADLEQAQVDQAIAHLKQGRLAPDARLELIRRQQEEQGSAQKEWLKARVTDDKEGIRLATARLMQAKENERALTRTQDQAPPTPSQRPFHA